MRRLRLLWVVPLLPRRGVAAARERWWALLARLATRHDITLVALVDAEDAAAADALPPGLAAVHLVPRRTTMPDDPLALLPRDVAGGYAHPAYRDAVAACLRAERFDLVQVEFTETTHLLPAAVPLPVVLTVHQLLFAAERPLWHADGRGLRRGAVLLHRYLRELDFELRAIRAARHVITMSSEDAARLQRFLPGRSISVSSVGVDCRELRPPAGAPAPQTDLLFVGNFAHPPNPDAVRFLVHDVLPRLARPARVRIVGHGATPGLAAGAPAGTVEVLGAVPDVRPHLARAGVVVAPVRFGTGMRGKVLEALAMGRPVVTTALGAEGLGAVSGRHLLVADDAPAFAGAIDAVLADPALAARLGAGGRALVESRFDWDTIASAHDEIYASVLDGASPPAGAVAPTVPLAHLVRRLGTWPAIGLGSAVLAARWLGWHVRARRAGAHEARASRAAPMMSAPLG